MKNLYIALICGLFMIPFTACEKNQNGPKPGPDPGQEEYNGILTDRLVESTYYTTTSPDVAHYSLVFSDVETDGNYNPLQTGLSVILSLYGAPSEDPLNAAIPVGTYEWVAGEEPQSGTWNSQTSYILLVGDDEGTVESAVLTGGTVTVKYESGRYTIDMNFDIMMGAAELSCRYQGPIAFVQGETFDFDRITEDVDITFENATGRYWANQRNHFADDFGLYFTTGDIPESGEGGTTGAYMRLACYGYKKALSDDATILEEGTYEVYPYNQLPSVFYPGTLRPGEQTDYSGVPMASHSHIKIIDEETGKEKYGFIREGKMTYSVADGFVFDFTLENGVKATMRYGKAADIRDLRGPYKSNSVLKNDVTLDLGSVEAEASWSSQALRKGLDEWVLTIDNPQGDMLTVGFTTDDVNGALPLGEYNVGRRVVAKEIIPGWLGDDGSTMFSWYGDNTSKDAEGKVAVFAPVYGGKMNIEGGTDGVYTITFDFVDDKEYIGETPVSIKGTWTGKLNIKQVM